MRLLKDREIRGAFGNGKNHYGLQEILYHGVEGAEIWVRSCLLRVKLFFSAPYLLLVLFIGFNGSINIISSNGHCKKPVCL